MSYLLVDVLSEPGFLVDVPQSSSGQIPAGLAVRRLLDLCADRTKHRSETALATCKQKTHLSH